jgi:hypothetical protein
LETNTTGLVVASTGISPAPIAILALAVSESWSRQILPAQQNSSQQDLFFTLHQLLMEDISDYQPFLIGAQHYPWFSTRCKTYIAAKSTFSAYLTGYRSNPCIFEL